MAFNLYRYQQKSKSYRIANQLPNGQTTINLPNGQGPDVGDGVQLTNGQGDSLQDGSENKAELKDIIGDLLYETSIGNADPSRIETIASGAINANIPPEFSGQDDLMRMVVALGRRSHEDPNKVSTNPSTGEKEQSIEDIATSIANMAGWNVEELINNAESKKGPGENQNINQQNTIPVRISKKRTPVQTTKEEEFKEQEKEDPAKKRKKGNPFKVLMGLVGKMLDHGMGRREIVKKVLRQEGNKWKQETIEKCIKVVMNARKKESRKESAMSGQFNLYKYAQKKKVSKERDTNIKDFEKRESIYDIPRDIKLMSTMELISRLAYLSGASNFSVSSANENNAGTQLNTSQFKKDLNQVKSELSRRNYNQEQIDILSRTVQGQQIEE